MPEILKIRVIIMKTRVSVIVCVILLISINVCFAAITVNDLTINGITLLSSKYDDVLAKLGEPKRKSVDEEGQPPLTHLAYAGFHASLVTPSGQVVYMMIDSNDYSTVRGVKIGATPYKVVKAYGQPQKSIIEGHVYYIYNTEPASESHLVFDMTAGYVSKIIITNLPLN